MVLMFFWPIMLLAVVSCQTDNSTDLTDTDYTETQYYQDQNYTDPLYNETATSLAPEIDLTSDIGIDDGEDGRDESLADYFQKKIAELIGVTGSNPEEIATAISETDLQNCSLPDILGLYCADMPPEVQFNFQYDTNVEGVLAMIFDRDIVSALQTNCTSGNWCLPDSFHQDLKLKKTQFYMGSPFCLDSMWLCLTKLQDQRATCAEKPLNFLVNSVLLMCEMDGVGVLTEECYARTNELLYLTYADMTHPDGSRAPRPSDEQIDDCEEFTVQMTKTFLCADDVCNFDQNLLLERFESWADVAETASEVARTCNISRTCQFDESNDNADTTFPYNYYNDNTGYDDYGYGYEDDSNQQSDEESNQLDDELDKELNDIMETDDSSDETTPWEEEDDNSSVGEEGDEEDETVQVEIGNDVNPDADEGYDKHDRSMMLGLIVMTTALLLGFVGLAFVVYKRFKRGRNGAYKWGYSQLAHEDPRGVTSDYK